MKSKPDARVWLAVATLSMCCLAGCSGKSERLAVHPVEGQVHYQGKPLAHALIALHPAHPADPSFPHAQATTDQSGKFHISTYEAHDGAPVGEYSITVVCYSLVGSPGNYQPGPNVLPAKYSRPETSQLSVQIKANSNVLDVIRL
jgi:hypothetical protein